MLRGGNDQRRPYRGGKFRGRGGRGAGRGGAGRGDGNAGGKGRGVFNYSILDDFDFPIQQWSDPSEIQDQTRGSSNQRGSRSRGRGAASSLAQQNSGTFTPSRRGGPQVYSPRGGRGRGEVSGDQHQGLRGGRGRGGPKLRADAPLSKLLYQERPFLKPIVFVPSVYTRRLFEEEEELVKPQAQIISNTEANHVPTADRITRIFSGGNLPRPGDSSDDDGEAEQVAEMLEEIDFEDMARIREEVDTAAAAMVVDEKLSTVLHTSTSIEHEATIVEERFTGILINRSHPEPMSATNIADENIELAKPHVNENSQPSAASGPNATSDEVLGQESPLFFIDTTPSALQEGSNMSHSGDTPALGDDDDEEIIVYVAPHPRTRDVPQDDGEDETLPQLPIRSILTGTTVTTNIITAANEPANANQEEVSTIDTPVYIPPAPAFSSITKFTFDAPASKQPRIRPTLTPRERVKAKTKALKKEARATQRKLERRAMFGSFGAIMSEAQLRDGDGRDPRWDERRRGDSDVDWGDTDEDIRLEIDEVDEISNGMGGMELDGDIDLDAMKAFVKGMSANGGRHVTMDDIADIEKMRREDEFTAAVASQEASGDENSESGEDASEVELVFEQEEAMIGEAQGMDISDSESDVDQSPNAGFQARLERMRKNAQGKKVVDADLSDDSDDDFFDGLTRGEEDDDFIAHIEAILDEKGGVISSADRKARNRLFRAVYNGNFSDVEGEILPAKRNKNKDIPSQLRDQWDKDRARKAEIKRVRAQARLDAAADPLAPKKGGKKARKAMLAASKLDPTIEVPNRIVDMFTVEQQIRRFLDNIGGKQTMVLPPMEKESRKKVHELALAFNLKSQSKGKGKGRYTTLSKTTRSGIGINEGKIRRIVKRGGNFMSPVFSGGGGRGGGTMPRHKEGDEVGKAAPKIGESNIGFKMLALMGWSEGDRIGISGGLDAPLTAVIKNTKLGLGANR